MHARQVGGRGGPWAAWAGWAAMGRLRALGSARDRGAVASGWPNSGQRTRPGMTSAGRPGRAPDAARPRTTCRPGGQACRAHLDAPRAADRPRQRPGPGPLNARQAGDPRHHPGLGRLARLSDTEARHPTASGPARPRHSASDEVTSIDRVSARPCPSPASRARRPPPASSEPGGRRAPGPARAAAMPRRRAGRFPFAGGMGSPPAPVTSVPRSRRVNTASPVAASPFGAGTAGSSNAAPRGVGPGIHRGPVQGRLHARVTGGDGVDPGGRAVATAPGGLAIEGHMRGVIRPETTHPPAQPRLEVGEVDRARAARRWPCGDPGPW